MESGGRVEVAMSVVAPLVLTSVVMLNERGMDRKNPSNDNISGSEVSRRKSARFRRSAALRNDRQSLTQPLRTSSPLQPSLLIPIAVVGISLLISHDA